MMGWRPILTGSSGIGIAQDSADPSTKAATLKALAAQTRAKARANGRCAECGQIVSMGESTGHHDDFAIGMAGWATDGDAGEKRVNPATGHEIVVRMSDGSSRIFKHGTPAGWRVGERVIVIAGTIPPHR
ncbi:MAG: hypothetical protein ABL891_10275 [Burkholderiales bacterium]